ncbi:hypothetical protein PYCCODRAFT_1429403 [Trametes coccinea BRFM310]|uniref:Uncharacterized protein n=1 Tax=Trametes coccinea (strain BRFM310) TaxID=1353009 RepID=A0A1Y2J788_TRAC3|nr:hypothetical protein PYCCODRAFT_1429403 [Trametes coccinea BRFM310]
MNANAEAIHAFLGPGMQGFESILYDQPGKMTMMMQNTAFDEPPSLCTQWWIEDLIAAQLRAEQPVCGDDPEMVGEYMAWLSEEQLQEIEELESCSTDQHANVREENDGHRKHPEIMAPASAGPSASPAEISEGSREGELGSAWMDQAERAMEVWAGVLRVAVDRANGATREEQARLTDPYADWAGPPPPGFDFTLW